MKIKSLKNIVGYDGSIIEKGTIINLDKIDIQSKKDFLKRRLKDGDFIIEAEKKQELNTETKNIINSKNKKRSNKW